MKLKLYSLRGVQEYWLVDRVLQRIEVYRRADAVLKLAPTFLATDTLTTPLLEGFACPVGPLFAWDAASLRNFNYGRDILG